MVKPTRLGAGKKLGLIAIVFFTVKGLLWLLIPVLIYNGGC